MHKPIKKIHKIIIFAVWLLVFSSIAIADEFDFTQVENQFKNFVKCELTRTGADDNFNGKSFEITMIDLFDIQDESDLRIVTGAVDCFVETRHKILYVALGIKKILGKPQVVYYTVQNTDFSILATQLMKYPYKERCKWSQYWIDID